MGISLKKLHDYTGQLLSIDEYKDYAPNGLQVEGRPMVQRLFCGVTASAALIDAAIAWQADAILVHHGYFWRNENPCIVESKQRRISKLIRNDISLLAYHLPLDAHPALGNNAQLGNLLGLQATGRFGAQNIGWLGTPLTNQPNAQPVTLADLTARVQQALGRTPAVVGDMTKPVQQIAWCSGGAQNYFDEAIQAGCDVYLTGEASEHNYHMALEANVAFVAMGHHASERYGVQALAAHLATQFDLVWQYTELDNPF